MELLSFWKQKKENKRISNWLYQLGSELRLGELPQFKKYKNKYITRDSFDCDRVDLIDFEECHQSFRADYYYETIGDKKVRKIENVKAHGRRRCGHRLCPICETIRARQEYTRLTWKMNQIKDDYDFLFLTMSLPSTYDNFRYLIDIMNKISDDMFSHINGNHKGQYRCGGFYSTWEVTYNNENKDQGFHPHLHTIIAIPKGYIKECKMTYNEVQSKRYIKHIRINNGYNDFIYSQEYFINLYIKLLEKYAPELVYTINKKGQRVKRSYINLHFTKCYNIENDVRELCKYFIDFTSLPDLESFIIYANSIYGVKRKKKRGCFKWTEADEENWKQFIDELHAENERIVQNKNSIRVVFTFDNHNIDVITYETVLDYLKQGQTFRLKFKDIQNE